MPEWRFKMRSVLIAAALLAITPAFAQEDRANRAYVNCLLAHLPDDDVQDAPNAKVALMRMILECRQEWDDSVAECMTQNNTKEVCETTAAAANLIAEGHVPGSR
jgi:hypothetical protein